MKKGGTIRPEQIRQAQRLLNELPVKDDKKTREEAAGILEKDFRKAFKKGYTPKELRECPAYILLYQFSPKDTGQSKVK